VDSAGPQGDDPLQPPGVDSAGPQGDDPPQPPGVDNGGVNRERAESHLRWIAETELRHAVTGPPQVYSLAELRAAQRSVRFTQVAHALTAIRAVEPGIADAIQLDYDMALTARRGIIHGQLSQLARSPGLRRRGARLLPPTQGPQGQGQPSQGQQSGLNRVAPVGMMIPVRFEDVRGELYVMAYTHTPAGARFTIAAWLRGPVFGRPPNPPSIASAMHMIVATDDQGAGYQLGYSGAGGLVEWAGELFLRPTPPPGIRWLDLAVGETTRRIQLDQDAAAPEITVAAAAHSPGEHYLHGMAARVLASLPLFPGDLRRRHPEFRPVLPEHLTHAFGDIIEALQVAGALSPLSPVPGQLRTLCDSIGITGHGITAAARADLPDPWLSLLTQFHRRRPDTASPGEGCAGVAVALPELDGIRLSILGLHNGEDGTVIHLHAAGLPITGIRDDDVLPLLWIRDEDGRWHTTRRNISRDYANNGELSSRLEVVPPLNRTSWIEVLAAGSSAEVRAGLALRWR
jgi:hypothetical protein